MPPSRPCVAVRTVVGRVLHEGVLGDAQLVEQVKHFAHVLVVVDHGVVVRRLPLARLANALGLGMRDQVHVRGVEPHEPGLACLLLALDEVLGGGGELVVAGLHALPGERARVLDLLLANLAPSRLLGGRIVLVDGPRVDHAARTEALAKLRILRIVGHLRLFLGVQVVEIAEELVEAVVGGQHVVQVAQVVLAKLACGVTLLLQQRGDGDDFVRHADRRCRDADLGQSGPKHALSGDERRASGGAGLLAVAVGEEHPLLGDAVDVRCLVTHQPVRVATQVRDADVVAPDDENVGLALSTTR
jgi:hypothetical protein